MAVETELKLRIDPDQLARLRRHPLIRKYQVTRPVTNRIHSIYFDTPRLELHQAEMALRLRRIGRQWIQTLKGGGSVNAGLHRRNEWEVPVSRAVLDFSSPQTAMWKDRLPQYRKLQAIFITDFLRTSRMLDWQGARIELSIDRGEVRADRRSIPICELELELKSGEPVALFKLALALLETVPLELEQVSKAEQGYRLLSEYVESPVKGVAPALSEKDTLAEALQALIWSCLFHFQGNLRGVMTSDDAEYLHQIRVALRRLRVVLRMAEKFRADESLSALRSDASALCVTLGRIREWDVFIAQSVQPVCGQMADDAGLHALLAASRLKLAACYEELRGAGHMRELQRLILRLALWMNGPYWQHETTMSIRDFANRRLRKLVKGFSQPLRHLDTIEASRLHSLRILAKKLRYSAEFFAALYDGQKARLFMASLSEMQDVLGQINDVAVAHHLLDELVVMSSEHREAAALVRGWIEHERIGQFAALRKAVRNFGRQAESWDKSRA